MDIRQKQLVSYLKTIFTETINLSKVADDASFRRYFRLHIKEKTFIIMDAPPIKENAQLFITLAKNLKKFKNPTPEIFEYDLTQGFVIIQDFGNITFLSSAKKEHFLQAIDVLIQLQKTPQLKQTLHLKSYNQSVLNIEMLLFKDWYLPFYKRYIPTPNEKKQLADLFYFLTQSLIKQPQTLVHRDFHSRNLMIKNDNSLGLLDFQDAIIGAYSYDLVSLLKDAYLELNEERYQKYLQYFYKQKSIKIPFKTFEKEVDLMGVQRHLKILGIFTRLAKRDKKTGYLKDIPLIIKYLLAMVDKYDELKILKKLL
jgi:aminoglycoside/choline kinase family phosphotransferase